MIQEGTEVQWNWESGTTQGKVMSTYARPVSRTIAGTEVTRNGSNLNQALLIVLREGELVLKLSSEVTQK